VTLQLGVEGDAEKLCQQGGAHVDDAVMHVADHDLTCRRYDCFMGSTPSSEVTSDSPRASVGLNRLYPAIEHRNAGAECSILPTSHVHPCIMQE
jgi:galactitol-specific phosphotransferase system IIB component